MSTAFSFVSFEIGTQTARMADESELDFYKMVLASLGSDAPSLTTSRPIVVPARPLQQSIDKIRSTITDELELELKDNACVVVRFNLHGMQGYPAETAVVDAVETLCGSYRQGSRLKILVSMAGFPPDAKVRWARGVASGGLVVLSDSGPTMPPDVGQSIDMDRWRYVARYRFGDNLTRFESKLTRKRGFFAVGEKNFRFEYSAAHAFEELSLVLSEIVEHHSASDRQMQVVWLEARKGWMSAPIAHLAVNALPGVTYVKVEVEGTKASISKGSTLVAGRGLVLLPVVNSGATAEAIRDLLRQHSVDIAAIYTVLTTQDRAAALSERNGVLELGPLNDEYEVQYLLRVSQERYGMRGPEDQAVAETWKALDEVRGSGVNGLDFWSFVSHAGAILERQGEVPVSRPPLVVPAFARGMIDEGSWLVDSMCELLAQEFTIDSACDLLVFPEGELATTIFRHGLRDRLSSNGQPVQCVTVPKDTLIEARSLGQKTNDIERFLAAHRHTEWRSSIYNATGQILLVDEFRAREDGALKDLADLIRIAIGPNGQAAPSGAAVALDLCGIDSPDLRCVSLYGWPSRQVGRSEYAQEIKGKEAEAAHLSRILELCIEDASVDPLIRILAFDQYSSLTGSNGRLPEMTLHFLAREVSAIVRNTSPSLYEGGIGGPASSVEAHSTVIPPSVPPPPGLPVGR